MQPETPAYLWDALEAARKAATLGEVDDATYLSDWVRQSAAERQLEVLGEALVRLRAKDPEILETIPHGHAIIGTRNVIAHRYDDVDHVRVLAMLRTDVPALVPILEQFLAEV